MKNHISEPALKYKVTRTKSTNSSSVVKSNHLIEASYDLNIDEQKLLLCAIGEVNSMGVLTQDDVITISVYDVKDLVYPANIFREIKDTCENLQQRLIKVKNEDGNIEVFNWLHKAVYKKGCAQIDIQFHADIAPYISEITKRFTQYKLKYVKNFTSRYSIRLYEMFIQWKNRGLYEITLDDLRYRLNLKNKYKSITDLQKRVIIPALKDINLYSDLSVQYGTKKLGRTVVGFQFLYKRSAPKVKPVSNKRQDKHLETPPNNKLSPPVIKHGKVKRDPAVKELVSKLKSGFTG